jgi:hypothetical protein
MAPPAQQTEARPMCPQYWLVFAVPGSHGASYDVWFDDPMGDRATCTCSAFRFSDRRTCKHIERVRKYGCFGSGPNDLRSIGVTVRDTPLPKPYKRIPTDEPCACGQMKWRPDVRLTDGAGRQVVRVRFHNEPGAREYTYLNGGAPLSVGESLTVPDAVGGGQTTIGTVVGLGSDFAGELKVIGT